MRKTTSLEIKLKLYHAHGLRPGCQQFMAEAPDSMEEKRDWKEPETFRRSRALRKQKSGPSRGVELTSAARRDRHGCAFYLFIRAHRT